MSWFRRLHKQKSGEIIEASTLADTAEAAEWAAKIKANPPLSIMSTGAGPLLRLAGAVFGVYVGVSSGTIGPRTGSTPGTGNFTPQTWNGTALANLSTITLPCLSISSTTGGIPGGTYLVVLKIYGVYWVITADCGN
jgi:hypothetical protein